tara:strand:+ start:201 stop:581 length:381 start_codon:yes stop_codon:yes gene_type:complete
VPSFLSDDWLEDLRRLGKELPKVKGASISCQHEISETPEGKIRFYAIWEDGVLSEADTGKMDNPDCILQAKYEDALDILHGRNKAEAAFMQGDLKVDGNYKKLLVDLHEWRGSVEYRKLWEDLRPS